MIPKELLDLRQHMYAIHTDYIAAWAAYTAVPVPHRTRAAAEACRQAGGQLEAALVPLIAYLEPLRADGERRAELERAKTIQGTLRRELGFIAKALSVGGPDRE